MIRIKYIAADNKYLSKDFPSLEEAILTLSKEPQPVTPLIVAYLYNSHQLIFNCLATREIDYYISDQSKEQQDVK